MTADRLRKSVRYVMEILFVPPYERLSLFEPALETLEESLHGRYPDLLR